MLTCTLTTKMAYPKMYYYKLKDNVKDEMFTALRI